MMKKTSLTVLLALLVLLQAVVAAADVHQYELASNTASETHDKQHHSDPCDSLAPELAATDHNVADCEHCCHCHGSAVAALAYRITPITIKYTNTLEALAPEGPSRISERFLRPPIV